MPNRTRMFAQLLVLVVLAFPLALAQSLSAAEVQTPSPAAAQAQALTDFLDSLAGQPDGESFTPAPQNKVQYCAYQACPTGQRCLYCHSNWICVFEYPDDPERIPSGCSTGGGVQ